ncbi:MAG: hypothetical protein WD013_02820 [Gemmatimonadota bacterium]
MSRAKDSTELLTLEPLLESVRLGVEDAGWMLSGLQKTTSHEFEGRWAGEATRSAYLFFHRMDLPESVSVEGFLDETSRRLRGNLALVLDGPILARIGRIPEVLERVASATTETLPEGYRTPVSLRLAIPDADTSAQDAEVQFRIKLRIPRAAVDAGSSAVRALAAAAVVAFEALLERPEVAEMLPPVVE